MLDDKPNEFSQAALEKGRLLFARGWEFLLGVPSMKFMPPEGPAEIAFAGRSNVGKSSLINALVNQKGLARTSNTPGRTQELNYFIPKGGSEDDVPEYAIVDMPGYGYAKAPKTQVEAWTRLVFSYLRGRTTLRRVFVLIDSRHGIKKNDEEMTITMVKNPDILADVAALKNKPFCVGFAAETNNITDYARGKMEKKNLDLIAANHVGGTETGFGTPDNAITLISKTDTLDLPKASKQSLARTLVAEIAKRL